MKNHEKILVELKMLDAGVIPNSSPNNNVEHHLEEMCSRDSRVCRRKWRKLKRKAMKSLGHKDLSKKPRRYEKFAVLKMLTDDRNT